MHKHIRLFRVDVSACSWYHFHMNNLQKNQEYTVWIEGYSSEGYGVCRIDGRAVFVPLALDGEQWRIRILKVNAAAVFAKGLELLSPSAERTDPACPYFGRCGGCGLWHMSYEEELRFKLGRVNDALKRIGRQSITADTIYGSEQITRYRNKAIFAVAEQDGEPRCGFYRGRSHDLIAVDRCLVQDELSERAATALIRFMKEHRIRSYDEETGRGAVRHVFCRRARKTSDAVACIVSARGFGSLQSKLVDELRVACPELTGIVLNINKTQGNTVLAGDFYTLWGKAEMTDVLCGSHFEIAPQAFFQVNPPQAERIYTLALDLAAPSANALVLDLYCGAGTISLALAKKAGKVIGAEIVPEAVKNAGENARVNGIDNAEFFCGDAAEAAEELAGRGLCPEVIVVDPPRKGMSEEAVHAVASMQPERIVYVSCDPATLARDILRFQAHGYILKTASAVDMFPRTHHVETVVLLSNGTVTVV